MPVETGVDAYARKRAAHPVSGGVRHAYLWEAGVTHMQRINLNGEWQLTYGPQQCSALSAQPPADWPAIPAMVPGNVELDLVRAGVLPEPSIGNNIYRLREYEGYEWWYRRSFKAPVIDPGQCVELVFDGLDCIAGVWVNGSLVGHADNMLIPHRFDVRDALQASGTCDLVVRIESSVLAGRRHAPEPLNSAAAVNWESLSIRKAPHMYGWDIMPRVVSAGLWRDVALEINDGTRWRTVYWTTLTVDATRRTATILVDWDFGTDHANIDG